MRNFFVLLLLASPFTLQAQSWKDELNEFSSAKTLRADDGHTIHDAPGGSVLKRVSHAEKVSVMASVAWEGKTYYMSDWSYERYQKGKSANWIYIIGSEPVPLPTPEPVEVAQVTETEAEPAPESLSLIERLEQRFGGRIRVFPSQVDLPAPKGHRIFSAPRDGRLLKSITGRSTFGAKAEITLDSGEVYYASTWSWNRAINGSDANWATLNGNVSRIIPPLPKDESKAPTPTPQTSEPVTLEPSDASGPPRVVALLVANGRYSSANPGHRSLNLETTHDDAALLAYTLRESGAEVEVVKDGTHDEILGAIDSSVRTLGERDVFFFYYAGHALQLGGKNYLAPLGISFLDKKAVLESAIAVDEILEMVKKQNLRLATLFLDGSRPNPFNHADPSTHLLLRIPGLNLGGKTVLTQPGLAHEDTPDNVMVVLPTKPGEFVGEGTRSGKYSYFPAALALAFDKKMEIRNALANASELVSKWSEGTQVPWISSSETAPFYLHTPGLRSSPPDPDTLRAAQWLANEGEAGVPMAMAHLAKSIRTNPKENPATAALLFLLGHQSLAVPLNRWGPFSVSAKSFSPDIQISLDGQQIALFSDKDSENPELILDRETGKSLDEISGIFSPAYTTSEVKIAEPHWKSQEIASVTTVRRVPEDLSPYQHAITPILTGDTVVGYCYDEGLERLYLAKRQTDGKVVFFEYATTPTVQPNPEFAKTPAVIDFQSGEDQILATGSIGSGSHAKKWQLAFQASSKDLQLVLDGKAVYTRPNAGHFQSGLEDWSLDASGESLVFLYRNEVEAISVDGRPLARFKLPTTGDQRSILTFSPSFRRLMLAQGEAPGARIGVYNLGTGREIGGETSRQGYREYASLSPNHEWFFHYDESGRWHMADSLTGGKLLEFRGLATQATLKADPGAEVDEEAFYLSPLEINHPPFHEEFSDYSLAPEWLPELVESILGFQLGENGEPAWQDDSPKRVESAVKLVAKSTQAKTYREWANWLTQNRLAAIQN